MATASTCSMMTSLSGYNNGERWGYGTRYDCHDGDHLCSCNSVGVTSIPWVQTEALSLYA